MPPASGTIVLLSGIVCVTGPLTVSFVQATFGLESFFLLMAGLLFIMAAISIWRVLTIPALPAEYKTTTTMQAPVAAVGSVLHPEEKEVAAPPAEKKKKKKKRNRDDETPEERKARKLRKKAKKAKKKLAE